jgi:hypothetical protein
MGNDKPRVSRLGRAGRMTVARKREAVIQLLRGDDLELVSRELGVTARMRPQGLAEVFGL